MLLPGLMASQVPVTGGRSVTRILEEQGKGRGEYSISREGGGWGSAASDLDLLFSVWPSSFQRPGTRQALHSQGSEPLEEQRNKTSLEPPHPVSPDCQVPEGHG